MQRKRGKVTTILLIVVGRSTKTRISELIVDYTLRIAHGVWTLVASIHLVPDFMRCRMTVIGSRNEAYLPPCKLAANKTVRM